MTIMNYFLNDKVFAIRRSDLQLDCIGCAYTELNQIKLHFVKQRGIWFTYKQICIISYLKENDPNKMIEFYQALLNSL